MYGGARFPPWPPSRGENAGARVGCVQTAVQPALSSPKCPGITGPRHCAMDRYASIWTGVAVRMYQVPTCNACACVACVSFCYKICAIRNNASLLRMLRDVGDSRSLGLAGPRLLATGKTGTTPGRLHRQQLSGLRLVTAPPSLSLLGLRISSAPRQPNNRRNRPSRSLLPHLSSR
jgi:hypothetical protein